MRRASHPARRISSARLTSVETWPSTRAPTVGRVSLTTFAGVALASVPVLGLLFTGYNAHLATRADNRRNQPVVLCHLFRLSTPGPAAPGWRVLVAVENGGGGPAFNVRFGIEIRGRRFAYVDRDSPSRRPSRFRVVQPGHLESGDGKPAIYSIQVSSADVPLKGTGESAWEEIVCWCTFDNSYGHTWQTLNAVDASRDLVLRRVRGEKRRESRRFTAADQ